MDIKNKVAIVTGGTGGIGFATVEILLKAGAKHVAIFDVEAVRKHADTCLQKVEKEFGKGRATFHACDVTKKDDFAALFDKVNKQMTVDILINNAGILDETKADLMIDINLKGVINCTLAAIERMGKHNNGKGGTILNVASIVGLEPAPGIPIYCATKYGVYGFTKSLKAHYEHIGVRTLTICPGVTQTKLLQDDWRDKSLKFVEDKFLTELRNFSKIVQPPENVAVGILKMLQEAEPGAVWVADNNEPPYAVKDAPDFRSYKV